MAGGDPAKYRELLRQADTAFKAGVGTTRGEAAEVQFSLRSAGIQGKNLAMYNRLAASGAFGDVGGLARSAAAMKTSLPSAGRHREILNQALVASGYNPADVATLLQSAARGGGSAKALGVRSSALLAGTAISGTAAGSTEQGATRIAAFLKAAETSGRYGPTTGLPAIVQDIRKHIAAGGKASDYLGQRAEAIQGFRDISQNFEQFQRVQREAMQARQGSLVEETAALPATDPGVRAAKAAQRARARLEQARERQGIRELRREQLQGQVEQAIEGGYLDPLQKMWGSYLAGPITKGMSALGLMGGGGDSETLRRIEENTGRGNSGVPVPEY